MVPGSMVTSFGQNKFAVCGRFWPVFLNGWKHSLSSLTFRVPYIGAGLDWYWHYISLLIVLMITKINNVYIPTGSNCNGIRIFQVLGQYDRVLWRQWWTRLVLCNTNILEQVYTRRLVDSYYLINDLLYNRNRYGKTKYEEEMIGGRKPARRSVSSWRPH